MHLYLHHVPVASASQCVECSAIACHSLAHVAFHRAHYMTDVMRQFMDNVRCKERARVISSRM